jgi:hypothetical protein
MWGFGDLYAELDQKENAEQMYELALAGFASLRGRSSKACRSIERRLQTLRVDN